MKMKMCTILSLLLVSVLAIASTTAVAQDDAMAVLKKYDDARARGDVDAVLALFANDAVIDGGGQCWNSPCVGKAAIGKRFALLPKGSKTTPISTYPSGNVVTRRVEVRPATLQEAGLDRLIHWQIYEIKDGLIVSVRHVRERTDPQTARYIKWRQQR